MGSPRLRGFQVGIGLAVVAGGLLAGWLGRRAEPNVAATAQEEDAPSGVNTAPHQVPEGVSSARSNYVGTLACRSCHESIYQKYHGSDHDRAIEIPSADSVVALFRGETVIHDGVKVTFQKKGEDFIVRTQGENKKVEDFRVAYTFGVFPLQQYLLDVGQGRLQALTLAWDSRPKASGGQRYFDLYPDEVLGPEDELHWSRRVQNWNFTCADCHTTALKKGYDEKSNTFSPSFAELDVGCEACHGPGSVHVALAKEGQLAAGKPEGKQLRAAWSGLENALHRAPAWAIPAGSRTATPRSVGENLDELETCAPCHSRRQQLNDSYRAGAPFLDSYEPDLLDAGLYHADGQVEGEVYTYGSFLQSRMFHAGVRCNDCHDPHSLELRRSGNSLCTGCHEASVFDTEAHHHHTGPGSACVDCHMPVKTFMGVDDRHDHSLRLPRPDVAALVGAPDACTSCHKGKSQSWATAQIGTWFGGTRRPHFAPILAAARRGAPEAAAGLRGLADDSGLPVVVRATALSLLEGSPSPEAAASLKRAASSREPLMRMGVARGARGLPLPERTTLLLSLSSDALLAVRTEAQRGLVGVPSEGLSEGQRKSMTQALEALLKTEEFDLDRPEARLRRALIFMTLGRRKEAERSLESALSLEPRFVPALVNLADLRRAEQNDAAAEILLRRATELEPKNADAWHALGLCQIRLKARTQALDSLRRAYELSPEDVRISYVYAVALGEADRLEQALGILEHALERRPYDRTLLEAVASFASRAGKAELAMDAARRLQQH